MPRQQLLIIDSRDRVGGDVDNFFVNFRPGLQGVHSVKLLWADIPSPEGDTAPYYLIATSLGAHVRAAVQGDSGTFLVPRTSAAGYRSFHSEASTFSAVVFLNPGTNLSDLAVSVRVRGGGSAALTEDWFMVLEVCCE